MSGFYISSAGEDELGRAAEGLSFTSRTRDVRLGSIRGVVTRVDDLALWGPARHRVSGVEIAVAGRVALTPEQWREATRSTADGGLAACALIEEWHRHGDRICERLNGAFVVLVIDARAQRLHLITDRIGIFPAYVAESGPLRVASHPDVIADALIAAGKAPGLDTTTVAEFLAARRSVHPHTYFRGIRQLDAGTHHVWKLDQPDAEPQAREYWAPAYRAETPPDRFQPEMVDELAAALQDAVRLRTQPILGRTGILLSGGADSRGMLFALERPEQAIALTFCDEPNQELAAARRIASSVGTEHRTLVREPEFYANGFERTVRISGGVGAADDGHLTGFIDDVAELGLGTLLSGCYADWLFKGMSFNQRPKSFLGMPTGLQELDDFSHALVVQHNELKPHWQRAVATRLADEVRGIDVDRYPENALRVEERRLRPLIREQDSTFRMSILRAAPGDFVLGDNEVLDVLGRLSVPSKMNGLVWKRAIAKIGGRFPVAGIRNTNDGTRLTDGPLAVASKTIAARALKKARGAIGIKPPALTLATPGSWINRRWYVANSDALWSLWGDPSSAEREFFGDLLGIDPWSRSRTEWKCDNAFFMLLLTMRVWLRQRRMI